MDSSLSGPFFEFMAQIPSVSLDAWVPQILPSRLVFESAAQMLARFAMFVCLSASLRFPLFPPVSICVTLGARERYEFALSVARLMGQRRATRLRGARFSPFPEGASVKNVANRAPAEHRVEFRIVVYLYVCICMVRVTQRPYTFTKFILDPEGNTCQVLG